MGISGKTKPGVSGLFDDYTFAGLSLGFGASPPDLEVFRDSLELRAFVGTGVLVEEAFFSVHYQHDFLAGSAPSFHIHWAHKIGAPSGNVKWQIAISSARGYGKDVFPAETVLSTVQAAGAQYEHSITDDDDMAIPGTLEPDAISLCRIFRDPADAADTFEDDAFIHHIDVHYEIGQQGTDERNRPFTSMGFAT